MNKEAELELLRTINRLVESNEQLEEEVKRLHNKIEKMERVEKRERMQKEEEDRRMAIMAYEKSFWLMDTTHVNSDSQ
jgi:uncharacterized protein YlxW (UPF0749 family)